MAQHPYNGRVFVVLPTEPWQFVLPLTGYSLGPGILQCHLTPTSTGPEQADLENIFIEGEIYAVQLEDDGIPPLAVSLSARLERRAIALTGMQLGFVLPPDPDIDLWFQAVKGGKLQ